MPQILVAFRFALARNELLRAFEEGSEAGMSKLRVGVIGVGAFGEMHVATYQSLPDIEVVAISDSRPERLEEIAAKYHVADRHRDYRELCARRDIELVSVVTQESAHMAPVLAAAKERKHVILEKPIATSVEDAERMIEATTNAGVFLMVGHILRFENKYATVKNWISEGRLGKVVSMHARRNRPKKLYRIYGERIHGILVNSIHDIDICLWYAGAPVSRVRSFTRNIQGGTNPDVNWSFIEFSNGAVACLESHWLIPDGSLIVTNDALQVIGTEAVADLHLLPSELALWSESGNEAVNVSYDACFNGQVRGAMKEEIGYFVDCVRRVQPPEIIRAEEALAALKVALALVRSSEERREVRLG
jgi:UDP-N-acetylglucosamine 3-dehydrogenase